MDNDKNVDFDEAVEESEEGFLGDSTSRARNRTVMLTPEITGEVRARLQKDMQQGPGAAPEPAGSPGGGNYAPSGGDSGFGPPPAPMQSQPAAPAATFASPPPMNAGAAVNSSEGVVWSKKGPIVGFLVSYDNDPNGTVFELRGGRLIVTSEAAGAGNYLVISDDTVSPMHAIMRISEDGEIQVLDQLSEYGTRIHLHNSTEIQELSGDKSTIGHGDVLVFGERTFCVCLVVRPDEEKIEEE